MQKRVFNINDENWEENQRSHTDGVFGRKLMPSDMTQLKITETKVEPGGIFRPHIDSYHHVLYFIEGKGTGWIGEETYDIKPGVVVNKPIYIKIEAGINSQKAILFHLGQYKSLALIITGTI